MNLGLKSSSVFRGRRFVRLMVAWMAVLVQLNVFFHLDLHQRLLSPHILKDAANVSAAWTRPHPSQKPQPFCPICQIVRQGAVQPAVEKLGLLQLQAVAAVLPVRPSSVLVIFILHPSGRSPPRG